MIKKSIAFLTWFAMPAVIIYAAILFFTSTAPGMRFITKRFLPQIINTEDVEVGGVEAGLSDELNFTRLELKNLKGLPDGTVIRIQRLAVKLGSLNPKDSRIDFENIRIFMPYSDPIVISGQFRNGIIFANAYSSEVSIEEILGLLPNKFASHPKGTIRNIDLVLEGPPDAVNVKGEFIVNELVMPKFTLTEAPGELAFVFKKGPRGFGPTGQLSVRSGKVKTKNTLLKLAGSKMLFSGSFGRPVFDVKGSASVGKVDIDVALSGTPQTPDWRFSSNPPVAQEVLMLMFLTGKNVETVQTSVGQKKVSPDLAKDLIDYFFLGGEGGRLAEKLGIKDFSIIYDKDVAGVGVKKQVTDFLDLGYQIEQKGADTATSDIKHTVGAEFKLNRHLSVEVDKELYQYRNIERQFEPLKTDDKVFLKYKTDF